MSCEFLSFSDDETLSFASSEDTELREFRNNSCDWFYSHLQKRFHDFGSAKVIKSVGFNNTKDENTTQVRHHIEKLVESLVGDNVDDVPVVRLCGHPSYDRLFSDYHADLSSTISHLVSAINSVMRNHPTENGETPTTAHAKLKSIVDNLIQETASNPHRQEIYENISQLSIETVPASRQYNDNQMFLAESYEDLLATVIINKVVTRWSLSSTRAVDEVTTPGSFGGKGGFGSNGSPGGPDRRPRHGSSENQSRCSSVSKTTTDSCSSSERRFSTTLVHLQVGEKSSKSKSPNVESSVSISDQEMTSRSTSGSRMSDSDDVISGAESAIEGQNDAQQYMVETEIEEVTEYFDSEPENTNGSTAKKVVTTKTSTPPLYTSEPAAVIVDDLDVLLGEVDVSQELLHDKVPFPEFGVDIVVKKAVDLFTDSEDDGSSVSSTENIKMNEKQDQNANDKFSSLTCEMKTTEWEDNWLFRRKKSNVSLPASSLRDLTSIEGADYVAMLVPNPIEGQDTKAKIGHRDFDEVSEMSERNSEASLDLASLISTSDDEQFNSIEPQKDLEYTEYSVSPLRRLSKGLDEEEQISLDSFASLTQLSSSDLEMKVTPQDVTTEVGKSVTFRCDVTGSKPIDVAWFRGTKLLKDAGDRIAICRKKNSFSFTLYEPSSSDAGTYTCLAMNRLGEKYERFSLNVQEPSCRITPNPPSIGLMFTEPLTSFTEEDKVAFEFAIGGFPEPRVFFLKGETKLQPNENIDICQPSHNVWSFTLRRCQMRDAGSYSVRAINSVASCQKKFYVSVDRKQLPKQETERMSYKDDFILTKLTKDKPEVKKISTPKSDKNKTATTMPLYPHSILKKPKEVVVVDEASSEVPIDVDADLYDRPSALPGTIADREHRKWTEQAIRLANNPYSRESIEKRLSRGALNEALSPTRAITSSHEAYYDDSASDGVVSDDGKENLLIISGTDLPKRIDCGPKSCNVSRYRRDYYVHSRNGKDMDVTFPMKHHSSVTSAPAHPGELVEKTKAKLLSQTSFGDSSFDEKESSLTKQTLRYGRSISLEPNSRSVERTSEGEDSSGSSVALRDSLEDHGLPDSGVGSSSEKASTLSKVETEISRFQREIERAEAEKSRLVEWHKKKSSKFGSSMDSLLFAEDHLPLDSIQQNMPTRGMYVSTGDLEQPPALPPKMRHSKMAQKQRGLPPKRVSISIDEVQVIGEEPLAQEEEVHPPPPDVVPQQFSRQNSNEEKRKISATDFPENLPSVRELANRFLTKKSPEPKPRKNHKRVDLTSPPVQVGPSGFHQNHPQQIHSLTARSVPRQFREGLKKSMPDIADKIIKIPTATSPLSPVSEQQSHDNCFSTDRLVAHRQDSVDSGRTVVTSDLNIIYDSRTKDKVPYPEAEYVRTPSPEHVGIPAGPLRMPPSRQRSLNTKHDEYTSDEGLASPPRARHPPNSRRKKPFQQI